MKWCNLAHFDFESRLLGLDGLFGSLPIQDILRTVDRKDFPFPGQQREKADVKKERRRWTAVPGEGGGGDPAVPACAIPGSVCPMGSGAFRVHTARSAQTLNHCPGREGVIYCFQFIVANKSLNLSLPIYSEKEDSWDKLGLSPIGTKAFPLGWMEHLARNAQGNKCALWAAQGEEHLQLQNHPAPLGNHKESDGVSCVWNTPLHKCIYYPHKYKIYIYIDTWECFQNRVFL